MDRALHPMKLEEVKGAPPGAMLYLEYHLETRFHQSGPRRASTIRAMICDSHMAAHYGQRFRCWMRRPTPEDMKAHEWRNEE